MARINITQADVFQSILTRLQTALGLNDRQCFAVARPQDAPPIPPGGDYFATVAFGNGSFPDGEQTPANITEDTQAIVTVYNRLRTDSTNQDAYLLMDATRGLMPLKKLVLAALVGQDLTNKANQTFLRQWCHVTRSSIDIVKLGDGDGMPYGQLQLDFGISFDWDLTV